MFIFVIYRLIIMFIAHFCDQSDGVYRDHGRVTFGILGDALDYIQSSIDDVYIQHTVRLYNDDELIGQYRGGVITAAYDGEFDNWVDVGP
jgi:hypothetical protein